MLVSKQKLPINPKKSQRKKKVKNVNEKKVNIYSHITQNLYIDFDDQFLLAF